MCWLLLFFFLAAGWNWGGSVSDLESLHILGMHKLTDKLAWQSIYGMNGAHAHAIHAFRCLMPRTSRLSLHTSLVCYFVPDEDRQVTAFSFNNMERCINLNFRLKKYFAPRTIGNLNAKSKLCNPSPQCQTLSPTIYSTILVLDKDTCRAGQLMYFVQKDSEIFLIACQWTVNLNVLKLSNAQKVSGREFLFLQSQFV